jgi:hypothetical protein
MKRLRDSLSSIVRKKYSRKGSVIAETKEGKEKFCERGSLIAKGSVKA